MQEEQEKKVIDRLCDANSPTSFHEMIKDFWPNTYAKFMEILGK
jgi:hypothetical protein